MKDFTSLMAAHPAVSDEIVETRTPTVRYDRRNASTPLALSATL
jgi:glutathione reductase (NADPH)